MSVSKFVRINSIRKNLPLPIKFFLKNVVNFLSKQHLTTLHKKENFDAVVNFFNLLKPYECEYPLQRYGFNGDGGYLIPSLPIKWDGIVSPGVGGSIEFEKDLAEDGTKVILIDGSVECPKDLPLNFHFHQKMLSSQTSNDLNLTLNNVLEEYNLKGKNNLLQLDIEGFEWKILPALDNTDLLEFKVFVVEFHSLDTVRNKELFVEKHQILVQLLKYFFVGHFHINNAGGFFYFRGKRFPKVVEITWLQRDAFVQGPTSVVPHSLDFPNDLEIYNWSRFG